MPLTSGVPDQRAVCRVHRFDGQVPTAVVGAQQCPGHVHLVNLKLYRCLRCGFPITMPLE